MKPVVGVMPLWDEEKENIRMLPAYMDGISLAGGLPILFPFTEDREEAAQLVRMCDGILLPGGPDVAPELYREASIGECVSVCPKRDTLEFMAFEEALAQDKPVFGICRGIQVINVCLGGSLYQDLPTQHPSETVHHQSPPYDRPVHDVLIAEGSPLHKCVGVGRLSVNSHHHQAISRLAPGLKAMAYSPDGLVEAVFMPEKRFVRAVQWHPERMLKTDPHSRELFRAFLNAMLS